MLHSIRDVFSRRPSRERLRVKPGKTKKMKSPIETLDTGQVPPTRRPCLRCQAEVRPVKPGKTILTDSSGGSGPVKPMPGRGSAKIKMYRSRHPVNPFIQQSVQTYDPRVEPGQTQSNQKMTQWSSQSAGCRLGLLTRRPCLRCQAEVRPVKPGKTKK